MKRLLFCLSLFAILGCFLLPARAQATQGDKLVALTFDDGPGPYTGRLLDGLKEREVQASFFMLGSCAENYPATVARVYEEGHQICNHSYSHAEMTSLSNEAVQREFSRTNDILTAKSGGAEDFFVRLPYGSSSARVRGLINAPLFMWSVDPVDWKYRNAATVRANINAGVFDGAIILVHDIHSTTVDGVLQVIDDLKAQGYEFVTLRELFRRRGTALQNSTEYYSCKPTGMDLGPITAPEITAENQGGKLVVTIDGPADVPIYYSVDGSSPAVSGQIYEGPITVPAFSTVRAFAALHLNGSRSAERSLTLTLPQAKTPSMRIMNGQLVLESEEFGVTLHYTLDGTPADALSPTYTGPIPVNGGCMVSACASMEGWVDSEQVTRWLSPRGNLFLDVKPDDWFADAVDAAAAAGYLKGTGPDQFSPESLLTRGQLVTILYRFAGEPLGAGLTPFQDVSETQYYAPAVAWAYENGLVKGRSETRFAPDAQVTRQEIAAIFQRFLLSNGLGQPMPTDAAFQDEGKISSWALDSVKMMRDWGLLLGDRNGNFRPAANCTRAEAAAILVRAAELLQSAKFV